MSQIRTSSLAFALLLTLALFSLSGCGNTNSVADLNPATGKHSDTWLPDGHKNTAKADISSCTGCHGQDLAGGIVQVPCTQCHLGNVGLQQNIHPAGWGTFAYAFHSDFVGANGTTTCAVASCHGGDLQGVANSGPSCAINCHMAGDAQAPQKHAWDSAANVTGHIAYFATNPVNFDTCRNHACHGGEGTTAIPPGVFLSGPACGNCHGSGNPLPAEI